MKEAVLELARKYWEIRDSGKLGDERADAHNALLDEMTWQGIEYEDREDAAQIAKEMLEREQLTVPAGYIGENQ